MAHPTTTITGVTADVQGPAVAQNRDDQFYLAR